LQYRTRTSTMDVWVLHIMNLLYLTDTIPALRALW